MKTDKRKAKRKAKQMGKPLMAKRFFVSLDENTYQTLESEAKNNGFMKASSYARNIIFQHLIENGVRKFESSIIPTLKTKRGKNAF